MFAGNTMTPPTFDRIDRAEEDARRAVAKRERLYTWIAIALGILGGGVVALEWLWR